MWRRYSVKLLRTNFKRNTLCHLKIHYFSNISPLARIWVLLLNPGSFDSHSSLNKGFTFTFFISWLIDAALDDATDLLDLTLLMLPVWNKGATLPRELLESALRTK